MNKKTLKIIIITVILAALGGCTNEPPKCSDDNTISLVRKIIFDQIGGSEDLTDKEIKELLKIEFPRASTLDEKIKKYSCEAKLIAGDTYQLPITYESQIDDKSQHIVSVGGIGRGDLLSVRAGVIEGIRKIRPEKISNDELTKIPPTPEVVEQPTIPPAPVAVENPFPTANPAPENVSVHPQPTWNPSFDCTKASTFSEEAVCTDPLLGKLDGALSQNYKYMLASDIGDGARNNLKITQKNWLVDRNKCLDNQCVASTYRKRIDEICEYPVISGLYPVCTSSDEIK